MLQEIRNKADLLHIWSDWGFRGYSCIGCRAYSSGAFARTCRCLNKPRCTLDGDRLMSGLRLNNLPCRNIRPGHRPAVRLWRPRNASESALVDKIVSTQKRHKPTTINPIVVFKNKMVMRSPWFRTTDKVFKSNTNDSPIKKCEHFTSVIRWSILWSTLFRICCWVDFKFCFQPGHKVHAATQPNFFNEKNVCHKRQWYCWK